MYECFTRCNFVRVVNWPNDKNKRSGTTLGHLGLLSASLHCAESGSWSCRRGASCGGWTSWVPACSRSAAPLCGPTRSCRHCGGSWPTRYHPALFPALVPRPSRGTPPVWVPRPLQLSRQGGQPGKAQAGGVGGTLIPRVWPGAGALGKVTSLSGPQLPRL